MVKPVYITGYGLISPLGHGAWPTFTALLEGRSIADRTAAIESPVDPVTLVRAVGGVSVVQHAAVDPAVDLAERAAREALVMAGAPPDPTPIVLGVSKGAMHALSRTVAEPLALAIGPHAFLAHHLERRLRAPVIQSHVAACASSLTALHHARLTMEQTDTARLLVVTAEAALLPMFVHSYHRLGVLACPQPDHYCGRPLDRRRAGFMLAELGAAVVLETRPSDDAIQLVDTAVAAEAHDMVRPSPDMDALHHVAAQLIGDREIDVLHAHATGTVDNDEAELNAYRRCGACFNDIYACKGALGHGLGAAGLVSLVIACICAKANRRPPMPWLADPIVDPVAPEGGATRTHAVFAAGFAGHVAGAVIA